MRDFLHKWWLYATLAALALAGLVALAIRLLYPDSSTTGTQSRLDGLREAKRMELVAHETVVAAEQAEIAKAKAIPDKRKRLDALAEIANRRRA